MLSQSDPLLIATPLTTLIFALYGRVMRLGPLGYLGGAVAGFLWSLLTGFFAVRLDNDPLIAVESANIAVFGSILATGALTGSAIYVLVSLSVLREPSTTYAVLSAMM